MHARAAYIRSFGTTGILLVAALLMLAMVGALVSFHRWPGGEGQTVPSVPLSPASTSHLRAVRTAGVHKSSLIREARVVGDRSATAGLVKAVAVSSPAPVGYPVAVSPGHVAPTATAPTAAPGGGGAAPDPTRPPAPTTPPQTPGLSPQTLQQLVDELMGSVPPPAQAPEAGEPIQVQVPVTGTTIAFPPVR